ncbi:MAG: hypothetical protein RR088_03800 [Clostridia bacterium]
MQKMEKFNTLVTLKKLGDTYKIIVFKYNRAKIKNACSYNVDFDEASDEGNKENEKVKLKNNLTRAKNKVLELAYCNNWDYFITLTLDKTKAVSDRKDLDDYKKKLSKWLNNYNRLNNCKIKYLLVPEMHKNGAWHVHGLISGIPEQDLTEFKINDEQYAPNVRKLIEKGYLNWKKYQKSFGYCSLDKIHEKEAICRYISKYVTKSSFNEQNLGVKSGKHLYMSSAKLNVAETIIDYDIVQLEKMPDWENDYCYVQYSNNLSFEVDENGEIVSFTYE